jgi:hypothetical protein
MDEADARQEAERLNRESPERDRFHWAVREAGGEWEVVRFETPGDGPRKFGTSVGSEPNRPDPGELPPPAHNPYWGA